MKLNKDQTQKLALGLLIMIGVIYSYFDFLLGPLQQDAWLRMPTRTASIRK